MEPPLSANRLSINARYSIENRKLLCCLRIPASDHQSSHKPRSVCVPGGKETPMHRSALLWTLVALTFLALAAVSAPAQSPSSSGGPAQNPAAQSDDFNPND